MRIGTMFLGEVEHLEGESIQTKFFVVGVPIAPISSFYALKSGWRGLSGFEIPLNGKSVGLGYLRVIAWSVALITGVFWYIERDHYSSSKVSPAWWIGSLAVAVVSTFFLGRLSRQERTRRTLLRALAGVGAPPPYLPSQARAEIAKALLDKWEQEHGGGAWDRAIENGEASPLLFGVAEYHLRPDLARAVLRQLIERREAAPPTDGPYR